LGTACFSEQHVFDWFSALCGETGIKISAKYVEIFVSLEIQVKSMLQVSSNTLQQVKLMYLVVVLIFTSDRSQNKEINKGIDKANTVLREVYCSVVTK